MSSAGGVRTAIYTRVSTTGQSESGSSLATQEAACRAYAAGRGMAVDEAHVYRETHSGAEIWERAELTRLRAGMAAGAFDALVCHAVDRLSRSQIHLGLLLSEAERHGVALHFVTEPLENTAVGIFLQSARAFAAELEREKFRERGMRGKRAKLASGRLVGNGTHPYGYRHDRERGVLVVEESEAAVVREMFRWVAIEGCSVREVARRLRARGTPPPGAGKFAYADPDAPRRWGPSQVGRMLRNPAYKGEAVALRYTADQHRRGRPDLRPPEEWHRLPDGVAPAIVPPALWEAARRRTAANTGDATRTARIPALLRGHVFCPRCGRRMYPETTRGRRYYRCGSRQALARCDGPMLVAAEVEAWAWERVAAALLDPRLIAPLADAARAPAAGARGREADRRALARVEREQERLVARFGQSDDPDFPWEVVERRIAALQKERARLAAALAAAPPPPVAAPALDLAAWCARAAANLPTFTFADRRLALDVLGVRVVAAGRDRSQWRLAFGAGDGDPSRH